jgi:hypothetical protein
MYGREQGIYSSLIPVDGWSCKTTQQTEALKLRARCECYHSDRDPLVSRDRLKNSMRPVDVISEIRRRLFTYKAACI